MSHFIFKNPIKTLLYHYDKNTTRSFVSFSDVLIQRAMESNVLYLLLVSEKFSLILYRHYKYQCLA